LAAALYMSAALMLLLQLLRFRLRRWYMGLLAEQQVSCLVCSMGLLSGLCYSMQLRCWDVFLLYVEISVEELLVHAEKKSADK